MRGANQTPVIVMRIGSDDPSETTSTTTSSKGGIDIRTSAVREMSSSIGRPGSLRANRASPQGEGERDSESRQKDNRLAAVQHARQDIPTNLIRAKEILWGRCFEDATAECRRTIGSDEWAEDRNGQGS